jgi:hypothetical protein
MKETLMSTSYTKFILFLLGIFISSMGLAEDPAVSAHYLDCSLKEGGVPVGVVVDGFEKIEKKDKVAYIRQVLDKENKSGKFFCKFAGYSFLESECHCPLGQWVDCARNSADSPNANSPHPLRDNAPRGTHHNFIEIKEGEESKGLKGALEKEDFFKKDFADPTDFSATPIYKNAEDERNKRNACWAYNADDAWTCGVKFHEPSLGEAPSAAIPPVVDKPVVAPDEKYNQSSPTRKCGGYLTCDDARDCENKPEEVLSETCAKTDTCTIHNCFLDYQTFCNAGALSCAYTQPKTNVPVPTNIAHDAGAAVKAIEVFKSATEGMTNKSGAEVDIGKCGLPGVMLVPLDGVSLPTTKDQTRYDECMSNDPKVVMRENLDDLETLLKAFAKPTSASHVDISKIDSSFLASLAKFEGANAEKFFAALKISNPGSEAIRAYNNLAASLKPVVGTTGASKNMDGTILNFAIKTNGGTGYLGVTPSSSSGALAYKDILGKISKPACMLTPAYDSVDLQKKYLEAVIRDHDVVANIDAKLAECNKTPVQDLPKADTKAHKQKSTN